MVERTKPIQHSDTETGSLVFCKFEIQIEYARYRIRKLQKLLAGLTGVPIPPRPPVMETQRDDIGRSDGFDQYRKLCKKIEKFRQRCLVCLQSVDIEEGKFEGRLNPFLSCIPALQFYCKSARHRHLQVLFLAVSNALLSQSKSVINGGS